MMNDEIINLELGSGLGSRSGSRTSVDLHLNFPCTRSQREEYTSKGLPIYKCALKGDVKTARTIIKKDSSVVRARITQGGESALHIAAAGKHLELVKELISEMTEDDMKMVNKRGNTALCFAATAEGNVEIAELMIAKCQQLLDMCEGEGVKPLFMAALLGHSDIVEFLYQRSSEDIKTWPDEEQVKLLIACIASSLFDVARNMIENCPKLIVLADDKGQTALGKLSHMPSAFSGGNRKPLWRRLINSVGLDSDQLWKESSSQIPPSRVLLSCILDHALVKGDLPSSDFKEKVRGQVLEAAMLGNTEFLITLLEGFPDFIWTINESNQTIFHFAVLYRHCSIFNLIYELDPVRVLLTYRDEFDNNLLHLAAKLAPKDQLNMVSGAALQMQRELLWFREVEKIVQPSFRDMKNNEGKIPREIFTMEHKILMEKGEDWMKTTAKSSMLVATIIASVIFSSTFSVPGGINDKTGVPNMLNKALFEVFYVSGAVALFSSTTSILMFLSILTSRYAEADFLHALPLKLMVGLTTLLVSITAMVVTFCAAIFLFYHHGFPCMPILLGVFSSVPMLFTLLKFPLLVDIIRSTYVSRFLFRSENRLFR